jgi:hypothetical protein
MSLNTKKAREICDAATPQMTFLIYARNALPDALDEIDSLRKRLELAEKVCDLAWADRVPNPKSRIDAEMNEALEEWRKEVPK